MIRIVAIVEGDGEVKAVPVLLRRIGAAVAPLAALDVAWPIRVPRGRFLKASGLEGYVSLAASRAGPDGRILVLLDANGDCPAELGAALLRRARAARPDLLIEVVLAKCEYEAWFIAAADSLRGTRGISNAANVPPRPGIDPRRQGVAPRPDERPLQPHRRPSRAHRPLRHDGSPPPRAVVRQDVARRQRPDTLRPVAGGSARLPATYRPVVRFRACGTAALRKLDRHHLFSYP